MCWESYSIPDVEVEEKGDEEGNGRDRGEEMLGIVSDSSRPGVRKSARLLQ